MISTSNEYKKAILKNRTIYVKCKIVFQDGTEMTLDSREKELFADGMSVADDTSNSGCFDIGSAIINQATFKIYNGDGKFSEVDFSGAVMTPQVGLQLSNNIEWIKKGIYIAEPGQYTGNMITVKAMDNMAKFDRPYSESNLTYPATLGAIVRDACSCCGVSLAAGSASFDNDDYVVDSRPDDSSLTFRQVLLWAGQISCHWCRCNENGELALGWYDTATLEKIQAGFDGGSMSPWTAGDTLDGGTMNPWTTGGTVDGGAFDWSGYHHIYSLSSMNICTDDVVITGIKVVEKTDGESDATYQSGSSGYVLSIEGNDFIQGGKGAAVAEYLGTKLIGLRFRPLSASCLSDPAIEAGDVAIVSDRKGNSYPTLITSTTFTAGNYQQVSCDAETPLRNSAQRFSEATRIYQELRKRLSKQKSEWENAIEQLGKKLAENSGLYSTIVKEEDGSNIYYLHDKETLEESMVVWKMNAEAWGVSTDGGKTWNGGMTVDGEVIARILTAIGVNADWINTGAFTVQDSFGNITFRADCDSKVLEMHPDIFSLFVSTTEGNGGSMEMTSEGGKNFLKFTDNVFGSMTYGIDGITGRAEKCLRILPKADLSTDTFTDGTHHSFGSSKFYGDVEIQGALTVASGYTKSVARDTENYGTQRFYCYEMPTPILGDIGSGQLGEDGVCLVFVDDIFQESTNTGIEYYVFLQKEGQGDLWIDSKEPAFFVVRGTPGMNFAWELKAKQGGMEFIRFCDESLSNDYGFSEPDYESILEGDREELIKEMEELQ